MPVPIKPPFNGANKPYGPTAGAANIRQPANPVYGFGGVDHVYGPAAKVPPRTKARSKDNFPTGYTCRVTNQT